jgi:hypothetical protein
MALTRFAALRPCLPVASLAHRLVSNRREPLSAFVMTALTQQQLLLLASWLALLGIAALNLRLACGLCGEGMPSYPRAFFTVLVVGPAAYIVFDFLAYGAARCMDDVFLTVPPNYSYSQWFWEPLYFKWQVLGLVPGLRYVPIFFALIAAGVLQVFLLEVTFRIGVAIFVVHWLGNIIAIALISVLLTLAGGFLDQFLQPSGESRPEATRGGLAVQFKPGKETTDESIARFRTKAKEALDALRAELDPYLEPIKNEAQPVTRRLPETLRQFLDGGGWWLLFAGLALVTLAWVRSVFRRLLGAVFHPTGRKKAKRRTKDWASFLREDLSPLAVSYTEPGPRRLTVKGLPARLRLVVMAPSGKDVSELDEDMADRLLDWIKPGLGEVAAADYPKVRIWPRQYSGSGFPLAFHQHVPVPERKGQRSHWVLLAGAVLVGRQKIEVGLALYTDEPNKIRTITVRNEQWLDHLGIKEVKQPT